MPALGAVAADTTAIPKDENAYVLFLRSTAISLAADANPQAIALLERSVDLDPTFRADRERRVLTAAREIY